MVACTGIPHPHCSLQSGESPLAPRWLPFVQPKHNEQLQNNSYITTPAESIIIEILFPTGQKGPGSTLVESIYSSQSIRRSEFSPGAPGVGTVFLCQSYSTVGLGNIMVSIVFHNPRSIPNPRAQSPLNPRSPDLIPAQSPIPGLNPRSPGSIPAQSPIPALNPRSIPDPQT